MPVRKRSAIFEYASNARSAGSPINEPKDELEENAADEEGRGAGASASEEVDSNELPRQPVATSVRAKTSSRIEEGFARIEFGFVDRRRKRQ